jgi:hypothetical protein
MSICLEFWWFKQEVNYGLEQERHHVPRAKAPESVTVIKFKELIEIIIEELWRMPQFCFRRLGSYLHDVTNLNFIKLSWKRQS